MKENQPKIWFARIDLSKAEKIADHYKIKTTPKIYLFVNSEWYVEYKGALKAEELKTWVKKRCNLPSWPILTKQEFESHLSEKKPLILFYGDLSCKNYVNYQETAKLFIYEDDLSFFHVSNSTTEPALLDHLGSIDREIIRVYVPGKGHFDYWPGEDEEEFEYERVWSFITYQAFARQTEENKLTLVNSQILQKIFIYHKPVLIFFRNEEHV